MLQSDGYRDINMPLCSIEVLHEHQPAAKKKKKRKEEP